jgi:DNA recombination protein RmuC
MQRLVDAEAQGLASERRFSELNEARARAETQAQLLGDLRDGLTQDLEREREAKQNLQRQGHLLEQELKVASAKLEDRENALKQQLEHFGEQKEDLKKEFSLLANKIFDDKGKTHSAAMDQLLKPFKEQLDGFQKRVNEVHTQSVQGQTQIQEQIKSVLEVGLKMSDEAHQLATALKSDKKAQGTWSEIQAELLLEAAGLKRDREYLREESITNEEGREQRPDFIVNLPGDKHIVIDSKISLNSYVAATAATEPEEVERHLVDHVTAIRNHVKSLSDKNYAKLKGINSPEYIFMFVGNEPAYLAAFDKDPSLFQDAYRKGIAIVTPNTLLSSLKIVSHLWSIDKQNSNTRQLAEQASRVYDKLRVFIEKMDRLGAQISTVQNTYEDSLRTLKTGKGNLLGQVDKFVDMGVAVKERITVEEDDAIPDILEDKD